jgi:hypothetical protein
VKKKEISSIHLKEPWQIYLFTKLCNDEISASDMDGSYVDMEMEDCSRVKDGQRVYGVNVKLYGSKDRIRLINNAWEGLNRETTKISMNSFLEDLIQDTPEYKKELGFITNWNLTLKDNKTNKVKSVTIRQVHKDPVNFPDIEHDYDCDCSRFWLFYPSSIADYPCGNKRFTILSTEKKPTMRNCLS